MPYGSHALALSKYGGAKSYQLKFLYNIFSWANCTTLIDGCVGMGSVSCNLPEGAFEKVIVNDKDSYIHNLWLHFQDKELFAQLKDKIQKTEHTLENYWQARKTYCGGYKNFSNLDIAWATVVSHRMSRNATPCAEYQKAGRMRGGQNECINAWQSYQKSLSKIHMVIQPFEIWNEDILDIVLATDDPKTLIYCDFPYMMESRACKLYRTEMTDKKHKKVLQACRESKSKIVISGRPTQLYSYLLHDWHYHVRNVNNNMSHKKGPARVKTPECIWTNFEWYNEK